MAFSLFGFNRKASEAKNQVVEIPLDQIEPNRYQPRQVFDKAQIQELAETIDKHGLLQPIIVREYEPAKYEIIAGERRYRAMKLLGWGKAPAIVEKMSDKESASLALIENLQRSQLSSVEEARAYQRLMELNGMTQSALAKGMGKSQSAVANKLRLLKLIEPVQNAILDGLISERHGRALLGLDKDQQRKLLMKVVNDKLTVRQTEEEVARIQGKPLPTQPEESQPAASTGVSAKEAPVKHPRKKTHKKAKSSQAKGKDSIKIADPRIAVNTIKDSVSMIKDSGLDAQLSEQVLKNSYKITIKIPKK